jgi:hypothetical protein
MNEVASARGRPWDEWGYETPYEAPTGDGRLSASGPATFAEFESPYETSAEAATTISIPSVAATRRMVVQRHPLLRAHTGTPPDLVIRWNAITQPGPVDVVVHFHGFSGRQAAMRLPQDKEPVSGLDFSDPAGADGGGRSRPTIALLPRGHYYGGRSRAGYSFPALMRAGALKSLVSDALARFSVASGVSVTPGRLILTGHSGGGAPITRIVEQVDPDEVHVFDGTYGPADAIVRWAKRRIARELASPAAIPPALRVLYRSGTGTQSHADAMARDIAPVLEAAGAERLASRFRIERTTVAHNAIPRRFGWRLLADSGADLADVARVRTKLPRAREMESEMDTPMTEWTANEYEAETEAYVGGVDETETPELEHLEWEEALDAGEMVSEEAVTGTEFTGFEPPSSETEAGEVVPEAFEAESYADESPAGEVVSGEYEAPMIAPEQSMFEALVETEAGVISSLADRVKGVAAFVLGPDLQRGSKGSAVAALQRALASLGHDIAVDGDFGSNTERAVKAFQVRSGVTANGVVDGPTKAAIANALRAQAPAQAPSAVAIGGDVGTRAAAIAEQEYGRWHPTSGNIHEADAAATPILQQYYREAVGETITASQLQSKTWQAAHPWSAVFISWVMRRAGATGFRFSRGHYVYVAAAKKNRIGLNTSSPFWAFRPGEVVPQVGDLICLSRSNSGATYDNIDDGQSRATHCDIVTEVRPGSLRTIGGNVNQNVDAKSVLTHPDGKVRTDGTQARIYAIVRCRGNIVSTQVPTPSNPGAGQPSGTASPATGVKLSPAAFVAAYGPYARASEAATGVPALVTLGQAALESGWGARAAGFNFFGVKAGASDPPSSRQLWKTREVLTSPSVTTFPKVLSVRRRPDGRYDYEVMAWFRTYPDASSAFRAHGELLRGNVRYARAFTTADPYSFAREVIRAGYATDPSYANVLHGVMRTLERASFQ